jgi:uncharacterized protein (TIGR03000 family)
MYSVMLMAALTAGGQTPDWHNGSSSGYGHNYGNCAGSCYGNHGIADYAGGYASGYGSSAGCGWGWGGYCPDYSSSGCQGCAGNYGSGSPYFVAPVGPVSPPPVRDEIVPLPKKPGQESLAPTKARLIVEVPADGKVYVEDQPMKTPAERRVYQTPDLEPGQAYVYDVRVEVQRDGKAVSATKRVTLKAGQEVVADFKDMKSTATAAR